MNKNLTRTLSGAAAATGSPAAADAGNASTPGAHGRSRGHTQLSSSPAWAWHDVGRQVPPSSSHAGLEAWWHAWCSTAANASVCRARH